MKKCTVQDLERVLREGGPCQVLDVREPAEFASEHLEGARNIPLSGLGPELRTRLEADKPVYVICRSGTRACQAEGKLAGMGFSDVWVVEGGLAAWAAAGKSVVRGPSRAWAMDRQVRMAAGSLVLLGLLLGWAVHPALYAIAWFVAGGLIYSAVTDTCGMAMVLSQMPWNRPKA